MQDKSQVIGQTATNSQELPTVLSSATATLHQRSYRRSLDRVKLLQASAVHPADRQRYLVRWSAWWAHTRDRPPKAAFITQAIDSSANIKKTS